MDYEEYKKYIFNVGDPLADESVHCFYSVKNDEVEKAEERINRKLPIHLKQFYEEMGYGFLCRDDKRFVDRIMDPHSIADFILKEGRYEFSSYHDFIEEAEIVFFELGDDCFLTISASDEELEVKYYGDTVANSLQEFLDRMTAKSNYFV